MDAATESLKEIVTKFGVGQLGEYSGRCTGCHQEFPSLQLVPIIGAYCVKCLTKLEQPVTLEGAITVTSIRSRSEATDLEFTQRKRRLREEAKAATEVSK